MRVEDQYTDVLQHIGFAIVEQVNGRPTETGLTEHLDVNVTGERDGERLRFNASCQTDEAAILLPGRSIDGAAVQGADRIQLIEWAGQPALRLWVTKGTHELIIE